MSYGVEYFAARETDTLEWVDVLLGLKAIGATRQDVIVEVGAGTGRLSMWLRQRGLDVRPCDPYSGAVPYCRLPDAVPPADVYVLQHVLEHVELEESVEALCRARRGVVAVVPGHFAPDPTHVYSHFTPSLHGTYKGLFGEARVASISSLVDAFRRCGMYAAAWLDLRSWLDPPNADWVVVAAWKPVRRPLRYYAYLIALTAERFVAKAL